MVVDTPNPRRPSQVVVKLRYYGSSMHAVWISQRGPREHVSKAFRTLGPYPAELRLLFACMAHLRRPSQRGKYVYTTGVCLYDLIGWTWTWIWTEKMKGGNITVTHLTRFETCGALGRHSDVYDGFKEGSATRDGHSLGACTGLSGARKTFRSRERWVLMGQRSHLNDSKSPRTSRAHLNPRGHPTPVSSLGCCRWAVEEQSGPKAGRSVLPDE